MLASTDGDNFTSYIIKFTIENGKQLYFIDENPEEQGTSYGRLAQNAFEGAKKITYQGDIRTGFENFKLFHKYNRAFVKIRDEKVVEQIDKIVSDKKLDGLKFAVIQGEFHRGTYRKIKNIDKIKSTRKFDTNQKIFSLESEAMEQIERGDPEKSEDLIKRDFLSRFVIQKHDDSNTFELSDEDVEKIARSMTTSDIDNYFKRLFNIKDLTVEGYNEYNLRVVLKQLDLIGSEIIEKYYKK